jgi:hypothetical protein
MVGVPSGSPASRRVAPVFMGVSTRDTAAAKKKKKKDRQTDEQKDRQTDRQTDRRQTDSQTDRQAGSRASYPVMTVIEVFVWIEGDLDA